MSSKVVAASCTAVVMSMGLQGCGGCDTEGMVKCVSDSVALMTGTDYSAYCTGMADYLACYDGCCDEPGMTAATKTLYDFYGAAPYSCTGMTDPCR